MIAFRARTIRLRLTALYAAVFLVCGAVLLTVGYLLVHRNLEGHHQYYAALRRLGPDASVTVAELVPGVLAWARGPLQHLTANCLDDPRVKMFEGDVGALIAATNTSFDAILLDVDNGPDGLTRPDNDRLYSKRGLESAKAALRPGGVLAVWSAAPDLAFAQALGKAGFDVDEVQVRARGNGKGARHVIWFATKPLA